jgi:hypothetical protein
MVLMWLQHPCECDSNSSPIKQELKGGGRLHDPTSRRLVAHILLYTQCCVGLLACTLATAQHTAPDLHWLICSPEA